MLRFLKKNERGVMFRLGRALPGTVGPGLVWSIPIVDRMAKLDLDRSLPGWQAVSEDELRKIVRHVIFTYPPAKQQNLSLGEVQREAANNRR